MLRGQISRKMQLEGLFNTHPEIVEVYSSEDFSFQQPHVRLYCLLSYRTDTVQMYESLVQMYGLGSYIHFTRDPLDPMFSGQRLIWKKGVWYD